MDEALEDGVEAAPKGPGIFSTVHHSKLSASDVTRGLSLQPSQLHCIPPALIAGDSEASNDAFIVLSGLTARFITTAVSATAAVEADDIMDWSRKKRAMKIDPFSSVESFDLINLGSKTGFQFEDMSFAENGNLALVDSRGIVRLYGAQLISNFLDNRLTEKKSKGAEAHQLDLVEAEAVFESSWHGITHLSNNTFVTASYLGRSLTVWADERPVHVLKTPFPVSSVARVSPDVFISTDSRNLAIWDVRTGDITERIRVSKGQVHSCDFKHNLIACGGEDRNVFHADIRHLNKWNTCSIAMKYDVIKTKLAHDSPGLCYVGSLDHEILAVNLLGDYATTESDSNSVGIVGGRKRNRLASAVSGKDGFRGDSGWIGMDVSYKLDSNSLNPVFGMCDTGTFYRLIPSANANSS
jgi:WD40 repeat protein